MAARGWARLTLDRRRDLINDHPKRAEAPLDAAQERDHFDDPRNHTFFFAFGLILQCARDEPFALLLA